MNVSKITPKIRAAIETDILAGMFYYDIAAKHQISESSVRTHAIKKMGIKRGSRGNSKWDWGAWEGQLRDPTILPSEIERLSGIPASTVSCHRIQMGIRCRERGKRDSWVVRGGQKRDRPELWQAYAAKNPAWFETSWGKKATPENIGKLAGEIFR